MRSLKDNAAITPVTVNANYPDGRIIDETTPGSGTAVIEEIYGDVLANIYKAIRMTGGTTTGVPDNESTAYQFLDALQKLANVYNDTERVLTLSSTTFTVDMNFDLLPNKYFFFAKVIGAYGAGPYTLRGTGTASYNFTSPTGFNDGAELLVIIDHSGARAFSITAGAAPSGSATFTVANITGSDPFWNLSLAGSSVPTTPKYLTMYIKNGDSDNQNKMITPAYVADTRLISGMPSPTDFPGMVITLFYA